MVEEIYLNNKLTSTEKSMLILLMASELDIERPMTRSFWSCLKRYTKLTTIAVKGTVISSIDVESGVGYIERELKRMGPEYKC